MLKDQAITTEISRLSTLKIIAETYEAVASTSIRRIRNSVLQNRAFHEGLNRLYTEVKRAYRRQAAKLLSMRRTRGNATFSIIERNGKTAFVLLLSNAGLYGDIIGKTITFFAQEYKRSDADAVVVGKMGKMLFEDFLPGKAYTYFDFPDNKIDIDVLKEITGHLSHYEKVLVFYGSFKSFFVQRPTFSTISGDEAEFEMNSSEKARYMFEPTIEGVATFFETEIFASLLEQVFQESRLAKLASRILLLQRAMQNIEKLSKNVIYRRQIIRHRVMNKKQLDANSGMSLWGQDF